MGRSTIPLVILAGSDPRPAELPAPARDKHALAGFKSLQVRIGDKTLIEHAVERLRSSGWFDPVLVAGPSRVYSGRCAGAGIVDTDGSLGQNVRAAIEALRATHPGSVVGFTVCDILPDPGRLDRVMRDYADRAPCDLWFPMVRAPESREDLGASAWKPAYRVIPAEGQPAVRVLPGHLVIGDVRALRLAFLYRLLDLGYRTRNRSIRSRRGVMIRGVLGDMLLQDLLHLARLRAPSLTWSVLRASIPAAELLRRGNITLRQLEDTVRKIFVRSRHRREHPGRRVVLPIVDALFLARDIDTEEEARELGGGLAGC
jgi:hypothetical protein